jgi:hypothetical protein
MEIAADILMSSETEQQMIDVIEETSSGKSQ